MEQGLLGLNDADFWDNYEQRLDAQGDKILDQIGRGGENVFALDAPQQVDISQRQSLPVIGLRFGTGAFLANHAYTEQALIVATDLVNNKTYVDLAVTPRDLPSEPTPHTGPVPTGRGGGGFNIDVRERLNLPWVPGEYLITVVMSELVTNRVRVRLVETKQDPAVAAFVAQERAKLPLPAINPQPGRPVPSYVRQSASPDLPTQTGIALALPRVSVMEKTKECIGYGSVRVPQVAARRLKANEAIQAEGKSVSALVPIKLFATGDFIGLPYVWDLVVPSFDSPQQIDASGQVTGQFALDLCHNAPLATKEITHFFYAFSGETMTGPVPMAFITEQRIKP